MHNVSRCLHNIKYMGQYTQFQYLLHHRAMKTHQSHPCSHSQSRDVDEYSDQKLDLYPCWIHKYGHLIEAIYAYAKRATILCTGSFVFTVKKLFGYENRFICKINMYSYMSQCMRFPTMWYVRPAKAQTSLRIRAV